MGFKWFTRGEGSLDRMCVCVCACEAAHKSHAEPHKKRRKCEAASVHPHPLFPPEKIKNNTYTCCFWYFKPVLSFCFLCVCICVLSFSFVNINTAMILCQVSANEHIRITLYKYMEYNHIRKINGTTVIKMYM